MQIREIIEGASATLRNTAITSTGRLSSLSTRLTERFGLRLTVAGAATAIFIGSTSGTAWGITAIDDPTESGDSIVQLAADNTDQSVVGISDEALEAAQNLTAAYEDAKGGQEESEPAEPEAVGGLNDDQMDNAIAIIEAGRDADLDREAWAVALACAMQESKFKNYANVNVPESYDHAYQAEGSDHDSVGLFQQRPSSGWGSVGELMDPETSASKFYGTLKKTSGWEDMSVTQAAQAVQISAYPDAYAEWEDLAWDIIDSYEAAQ